LLARLPFLPKGGFSPITSRSAGGSMPAGAGTPHAPAHIYWDPPS
jgi:hypothetical protein